MSQRHYLVAIAGLLAGLVSMPAQASQPRCKSLTGTEKADALIASVNSDFRCALPWHALKQAVKDPSVYARLQAAYADAKVANADKIDAVEEMRTMVDAAAGRPEAAIAYYDNLLAKRPADASALNTACWIPAQVGRELDIAQKYCNAAVAEMASLPVKQPGFLMNRGKVELLRGDYQAATRDYNEAVVGFPASSGFFAISLYGRGVARLKAGDRGGASDIKIASGLYPKVGDDLADLGIKP